MGKETIEIEVPFGKKLVQTEMELGTLITFEEYSLEDAKKEIESLKKEIEKLKGYKDISPAEKWLLELIDGVKPITDSSGNIYWYNEDGNWLFTQDFMANKLWVEYEDVWVILKKYFKLPQKESQELIKSVMYDYTSSGLLTPTYEQ